MCGGLGRLGPLRSPNIGGFVGRSTWTVANARVGQLKAG